MEFAAGMLGALFRNLASVPCVLASCQP